MRQLPIFGILPILTTILVATLSSVSSATPPQFCSDLLKAVGHAGTDRVSDPKLKPLFDYWLIKSGDSAVSTSAFNIGKLKFESVEKQTLTGAQTEYRLIFGEASFEEFTGLFEKTKSLVTAELNTQISDERRAVLNEVLSADLLLLPALSRMGLYIKGDDARAIYDVIIGTDKTGASLGPEFMVKTYPKSGVIKNTIEFSGIVIYAYYTSPSIITSAGPRKSGALYYIVDLRSANNARAVVDFAHLLLVRSRQPEAMSDPRLTPWQITSIVRRILNRGLPAIRDARG